MVRDTRLQEFRRILHRYAERSGEEKQTATIVREFLEDCEPDQLITNIGGNGLAALYQGQTSRPTILIRADMDALPIPETVDLPHRSQTPEVSHKCGHDGHTAIVAGLAARFHEQRPTRGSVVLLFQPAEETGQGARQVLDDPKFSQFQPDFVFALHNLPGALKGQVLLREGTFASASKGLIIQLKGATSHASEPEI